MIEDIQRFVVAQAEKFGLPSSITEKDVQVMKFSQRVAKFNTKMLFLVSVFGEPVCVVKAMRDPAYDAQLKHEADAQAAMVLSGVHTVPRVLYEGEVQRHYVYAESFIDGHTISPKEAIRHLPEIIALVASFPKGEAFDGERLLELYQKYAPAHDAQYAAHVAQLMRTKVPIHRGATHSDLGRVNIMKSSGGLRIIDWERANQRPIWLIDAAYFIVRTLRVRNEHTWLQAGVPLLVRYAGCTEVYAQALYHHLRILDILRYQHPIRYKKVVSDFVVFR